MKNDILNFLENETAFLDLTDINEVFTAKNISERFGIKRNTASHYLNELTNEGELIKIDSRPVYFFHKKSFESQNYLLKQNVYKNVDEVTKERPIILKKNDLFSLLIGRDRSLKQVIDQVESALYYPGNGLPTIFTGESGTGKTYLVHLIYQYCIDNGLINDNAPFVTINCAQYANNPELLTSNLFGHVKGAYTGADTDKEGAFEAANNGILFLDEVHRLNSEGQEKLFTFLDQGIVYKMGDTNHPIKLNVRLFFATTESLKSEFLTTFIRRIPIQIEMPPLSERGRDERLELVYSFFLHEQRKIKKTIRVSGQVLNLLVSSSFKGNIGELKNCVMVTAARAFSQQRANHIIDVNIYYLPTSILKGADSEIELSNESAVELNNKTVIQDLLMDQKPQQQMILKSFERIIHVFQENNSKLIECNSEIKDEVNNLFDYLMFETDFKKNYESLTYLTKNMRNTLNQMETSYQVHFNGSNVYAISYYILQRANCKWRSEEPSINQLIGKLEIQIKETYPTSYKYIEKILQLCETKVDIDIESMDKILLTLYLSKNEWNRDVSYPKAVIVAHGYATASSIANVANTFLKKDIFESFDMPIKVTPQKIAEEIVDYSKRNDVSKGLIILVDMGSLKDIYQYFSHQIKIPIVIMNNVTTPLAISVGEQIQKKITLKEQVKNSLNDIKMDYKIIYPETNMDKAIITTCMTGIGTETKIAHLIEKSLPNNVKLKVLPYEFSVLKNKDQINTLLSMYDCLGVIGTDNPNINKIPYISLEHLISGEGITELSRWFSNIMGENERQKFNDNIVRNFSLEKVMDVVTILDTNKVVREIDLFIKKIEKLGRYDISNGRKLALYVHISCLIERLVRNTPITNYEGYEELEKCQKDKLTKIKMAFSVIESDYSVNVPKEEIAYVYDLLFRNTETSTKDEEF